VFSAGETIRETTTGLPGGDTGNQATIGTPQPQSIVEPTSGKKALGWALNDPPPSSEVNWRSREVWRTFDWLQGNAIRRFTSGNEAIAQTTPEEFFIVQPNLDGSSDIPGSIETDITGLSGVGQQIYVVETDAEKAYYYSPDPVTPDLWNIHAVNPDDGTITDPLGLSRFWTVNLGPLTAGSVIDSICCAGTDVLVFVNKPGAFFDIYRLNRDTGAVIGAPLATTWGAIANRTATDGLRFAIAQGTQVEVGNINPLAGFAIYNHGATVFGVDLDHEYLFIAGTLSGGVAVRALQLPVYPALLPSPMPVAWSWSPTATPFVAHDVCTDGEHVYVVGDSTTVGGNFNTWCVSRIELGNSGAPQLIWRTQVDVPGTTNQNAYACCVDDRFLYVATNGEIMIVNKRTGAPVYQMDGGLLVTNGRGAPVNGTQGRLCCDGRHVFWGKSATPFDRFISGHRGLSARLFKRAKSDEQNRRPNHILMLSAEEY
jgi:hypothetical protein